MRFYIYIEFRDNKDLKIHEIDYVLEFHVKKNNQQLRVRKGSKLIQSMDDQSLKHISKV